MSRNRILALLLSPSLLSGLLCFGIATVILVAAAWSYISTNFLFYEYFFGAQGVVTAVVLAPDIFTAWRFAISRSPLTYFVVTGIVSVIVGLVVYVSLRGIEKVWQEILAIIAALRNKGESPHEFLVESLTHFVVRILSAAVWVVFWVFLSTTIMPFCVLLVQSGIDALHNDFWGGIISFAESFAVLVVALHLNVVFARMTLLRPRVFGGGDDLTYDYLD